MRVEDRFARIYAARESTMRYDIDCGCVCLCESVSE